MKPSKFPDSSFEGCSKRFPKDNGGTAFHLKNDMGYMLFTRYPVFPGIDFIYNDICMPFRTSPQTCSSGNILEIEHCREGRMECQAGDDYFYLTSGDISIHRLSETLREEIFPSSHYQGLTIRIDLNKSPQCLRCFLEDVNVEPAVIAEKFLPNRRLFFALRKLPAIEHIFSELYSVPAAIQKGYFKVKLLELFLFLSALEPREEGCMPKTYSRQQADLAKDICGYLKAHPEKHITTAELASRFGVSVSQIKSSFLGVYGTSAHSYMRAQRMEAAAQLLRHTDRTVLDIAGQFGYDNGSKFASAFRTVMGVSPSQYRNDGKRLLTDF